MKKIKNTFKISIAAIILCAMVCTTFAFLINKKDKNIAAVNKNETFTDKKIITMINHAHAHNFDLNTIYFGLKEHNYDYSKFFDKLIDLYINKKIDLSKDDIHKLCVYEFGDYALGDLLFQTDFSNDNIDENVLAKILFNKPMSPEKKRTLLEKNHPGMQSFFKSGETYGYKTSNLISFLTLRAYVDIK